VLGVGIDVPAEDLTVTIEIYSDAALTDVVERIPDGAVVLLDGLVASTAPEALVAQARRLRLVALVHMPLGQGPEANGARTREGAVLEAAAAVVTTSGWARRTVLDLYALPDDRVHVAEPGADPVALANALLLQAACERMHTLIKRAER